MQCKHIKQNNKRCKGKAIKGSNLCYFHSPDHKDDRKVSSSRGGENSKKNIVQLTPVSISNPDDILSIISETINLLRSGKVHPNYANSIFIGCNNFLKTYKDIDNFNRNKRYKSLDLK